VGWQSTTRSGKRNCRPREIVVDEWEKAVRVDWRIERVNRQLQRGCTLEPRTAIARLAGSLNLSTSRLRHLFKNETGLSLKRCLIQSRLESGRIYLETSLLSIKEISIKVGYTHMSHFVRDFRRLYQATPSQYRKQRLKRKQTARVD
jgi:AraC family transcriptional regulator, arabinose operon regulatory protein